MTFIAVISIVFISAVYTLDSLTLSSYQPFLLGTVDENNIYISNTNVDMIFNVITKEKTFLSSHLSYLNYNNFPWVIIRNSIKYIFDNNKYIYLDNANNVQGSVAFTNSPITFFSSSTSVYLLDSYNIYYFTDFDSNSYIYK